MTPKPKQPRKHLQISEEEFAKLALQYEEKKSLSLMDKLLSASWDKTTPRMEIRPIMAGSTDSSQRMVDFTEARRMGLPAGDVDKYRSQRNAV